MPLPLSLYIHTPFCARKCDYCHFYVIPHKAAFQEKFLKALKKEWELRQGDFKIESVYFGGGTPSLLGAANIKKILSWLAPLPEGIEITLETNPEVLVGKPFLEAGINRLSMGVQSFDDSHLAQLSRQHGAATAKTSIMHSYEAGFKNISIDLMYDLPGQTVDSWKKTLRVVETLPITHLSLYNLTFEPHTVFYKKRKALLPTLPTEKVSAELLNTAISTFKSYGFEQYEISAFAKKGKRSKHNVGYWTGRPFLGLGPSAFSFMHQTRFRNKAHFNGYCNHVFKDELPTDFSEKLAPINQLKEHLAIGLRVLDGVNLPTFCEKWGPLPKETQESLIKLQQEHFISLTPQKVALTKKGVLFYDSVATELI